MPTKPGGKLDLDNPSQGARRYQARRGNATKTIKFKVTPAEHALVKEAADREGASISNYCMDVLLRNVVPKRTKQ